MDPLSVTASGVALVSFLHQLLKITVGACQSAKTLADIQAWYSHAAQLLADAISDLQRLCKLEIAITSLGGPDLQKYNLPASALRSYYEATKDLSACLATRKKNLDRPFYRFKIISSSLFLSRDGDAEIRAKLERFTQTKSCVAMVLIALQTLATISIKGDLASVTSTQHSVHRSIKDVQDTGLSTHQSLGRLHTRVDANTAGLHSRFDENNEALTMVRKSTTKGIDSLHSEISDTREKIIEKIDSSITALVMKRAYSTATHYQKRCEIPFPRNYWFTGRERILTDMSRCLIPDMEAVKAVYQQSHVKGPRIFGLHGLPGIGKSHVAAEFGYRQWELGAFTHIFWISADDGEKLEQGYVNIARSLGLASTTSVEEKDKTVGLARTWLRDATHGVKWLLILDNVDDFKVLNPYWADFHLGSILLTSRDSAPGLSALSPSSKTAQLMPLTPDEGTELIKKRLQGRILGEFNDSSAAKLALRLSLFPLYMDQVASFIEASRYSLADFYRRNPELADQQDGELQQLAINGIWYPSSVAAAMENHIMRRLEVQVKMVLKTMAFFDPDEIPERLLVCSDGQQRMPSLATPTKCQSTLNHLARYSFVYPKNYGGTENDERCVGMHRLVRDAALRLDTSTQVAFDNAVFLLRRAFPLHGLARDHMVEEWVECERFQPHVLALHKRYLELRCKESLVPTIEFLELIYSCAWYLCERGRFEISEKLISSIYQDCLERIPPDPSMSLFLADIYTVQLYYHNETDQGESLVDIALKAHHIREEAVQKGVMDLSHPNRANGFMNVGVALAHKDPHRAIELHSAALDIRLGSERYAKEQVHGIALNYLNIGRCWWMVKKLDRAATCFEECLILMRSREKATGKRFPVTAWAMFALAIVRAEQDDLESAVQLLSESMALHRDTLGETHMKTLACYYRFAWVCHRMGELERAEQILRMTLKIYENMASKPRPEIARTRFKLSQVLEGLGGGKKSWQPTRLEAVQMLGELVERQITEAPREEMFDECIAYFLR